MTSEEDFRRTLQEGAEELNAISEDIEAKFLATKMAHERRMRRYRFFSTDRRLLWRLPKWLWLPLVVGMVALLLVGFLVAESTARAAVRSAVGLSLRHCSRPRSLRGKRSGHRSTWGPGS